MFLLILSGCGNELYKQNFTPEQQKIELQKIGFLKYDSGLFDYDLSSFEVPELEEVQYYLRIIVYYNLGFNSDETIVSLRTRNEWLEIDSNGICYHKTFGDDYNCTGKSIEELKERSNIFYALDNDDIFSLWYDTLSIMHINPEELFEF